MKAVPCLHIPEHSCVLQTTWKVMRPLSVSSWKMDVKVTSPVVYGQKVGLPFVQEGLVQERFPKNFQPVIKRGEEGGWGSKD